MLIIWNKKFDGVVERNILSDTEPENSLVIIKRQQVPFISRFGDIIGSISSALPFLDLWTCRYTISFQLIEGMESLPAGHADFNKHYENVGQFP